MADTSSILNLSNINVYGDLSGSILLPKVLSLNNVKYGILNIVNGGTGLSSFPNGQILIGKDGKIGFITGSADGESIIWSSSLDSWITARFNGLNDLTINLQQNPLFEITTELSGLNYKTYSLTNKEYPQRTFLATSITSSSPFEARIIEVADLPQITGVELTNITSSGMHFGNFDGEFIGNFSGSVYGVISGSLMGDGYEITNINPNNIQSLDQKISDTISNLTSAFYTNLTASNVYFEDGYYSGFFYGDASNLYNIPISDPVAGNNINITKDGLNNNIISVSDFIEVSGIYSNEIDTEKFTSNEISAEVISGSFYGDGYGLYNIPASALENPLIIINGQVANLGERVYLSGTVDYLETDSNITGTLEDGYLSLALSEDLDLNNINVSTVSADVVDAYIVSSSFYGNGSGITNIQTQNISGLRDYINSLTNVDGTNIVIDSNNKLSLGNNLFINNFTSLSGTITDAIITKATIYELSSTNITLNNIDAGTIKGDGSQIINIQAANIADLEEEVKKVYKGGANVVIDANGYINLLPSLAGVGSVASGVNLTGGGSGDIAVLNLADNIYLSTVSASAITASKFIGNGSLLSNISFDQLTGTPNFSQYATTSSLNALSFSFSNFSSSINQTIVEKVNSIDLTKYVLTTSYNSLSSSISSSNSSFTNFSSSIDTRINNTTFDTSSLVSKTEYSSTGYSVGDPISFSGSMMKADYSSELSSNVIGIVGEITDSKIKMQYFGDVSPTQSLSSFSVGEKIYLGQTGSYIKYSDIPSGKYANQIGVKNHLGTMSIQIRSLWKVN